MLSSTPKVSSILDSYSRSGPSTNDVLFKEDLSLAVRLEPKMASKSTLEALSLGFKMQPNLRCMYISKVQVELESIVKVFSLVGSQFLVLMH